MTPPQPKRITTLPAAPLGVVLFFLSFFFLSFSLLFCWSRHFLLNSYDLHPTTLPFVSLSLFLLFSYLFTSSNSILSILRLSISFCLILPFLGLFSFSSCKYLSVYSNVVLPLYLLSSSPSTLDHYYTCSICRPSSTASNTSTLTSPTCKITTTEAAPGGDPRWLPRTLSASSAVSRA